MLNGFLIGLLLGILVAWDVLRRQRKLEKKAEDRTLRQLEDAAREFDRLDVLSRAHKRKDPALEADLDAARTKLHVTALGYASHRGYHLDPG